jgi:phosphoenolpyruvate synthase/pyruvate phosphate dikinase
MTELVLGLEAVDRTQIERVGGKAAHLGELTRLDGVHVPPGFCMTTLACRRILAAAPELDDRLARLDHVDPADEPAVRELSAAVREAIETASVPDDVGAAITAALARLGDGTACAVRSSATAEDGPGASFAGQHDSFLDVTGAEAVLHHARLCIASLYTERAVAYRRRRDQRDASMAVVVQRMVAADAAGVLFTADPITSNRTVAVIESVAGLGDALVSGLVNADVHRVRGSKVVAAEFAGERPVLTEAQVLRLTELGRRIEAHLGSPQDIEWCRTGDRLEIVQSRPITTLFPIPATPEPGRRVFISVGHGQMMTEPIKPLGISMWQLTSAAPMREAGCRLFVDVTERLTSPQSRAALLDVIGRSDPLMRDALGTILESDDAAPAGAAGPAPAGGATEPPETDRALVAELMERTRASVAAAQHDLEARSGTDLLGALRSDIQEMRRILFDAQGRQVYMSAMEATWWLNEHIEAWLGERNVADTLTLSVDGNVTSEMGLALLDVADVIRPHPDVIAALQDARGDDGFLDRLTARDGGREAHDAIVTFLERYGMRCVGEIDITRPRWSERPSALVPLILGNIRNFAAGESARRFRQGFDAARAKEQDVLERIGALPGGAEKAAQVKQRIDRVRTFIGYREFPKYGMISRYLVYKRVLLEEAGRLVAASVLRDAEDIFFLSLDELEEVVRTQSADHGLISQRRAAFLAAGTLTPPRVITSEGDTAIGSYRRSDVPDGALAGLAVSAGTVEGRARVLLDMADADLGPDDILVTVATDPSWTPVFVAVKGLVTEVGGLMTHGAVIAREYGLPAVVGVEAATRRIRDGQRIRVHGTEGYVEILTEE